MTTFRGRAERWAIARAQDAIARTMRVSSAVYETTHDYLCALYLKLDHLYSTRKS